jgi:hypothetical protein
MFWQLFRDRHKLPERPKFVAGSHYKLPPRLMVAFFGKGASRTSFTGADHRAQWPVVPSVYRGAVTSAALPIRQDDQRQINRRTDTTG